MSKLTLITLLGLIVLTTPRFALAAAKPLLGVSCKDSFFILVPDGNVKWIDPQSHEALTVHSPSDNLRAIAECGEGVLTVVREAQHDNLYYSPNCLNLARAGDTTQLVLETEHTITKLTPGETGLTITLSDSSTVHSDICKAPVMPSPSA